MNDTLPTVDQLAKRLRDIAAGARSKADLIASASPTSAYIEPVAVLRALAQEAEKGLPPAPMTYEQITNYLDGRPLVSALWWFMENVDSEDEHCSQLFFYLRERVRNLDPKAEYKFTRELAKLEG
jgi:hypothetical protein